MHRLRIAACAATSAQSQRLAFVASFAAMLAANLGEVQLLPAGEFRAIDGRPGKDRSWKLDQATAAKLIELFNSRANDLAIDYEHQTFRAEQNGSPRPRPAGSSRSSGATAWASSPRSSGPTAPRPRSPPRSTATSRPPSPTTRRARGEGAHARGARELPAIDGMQEVALSALARGFDQSQETDHMNPLLALASPRRARPHRNTQARRGDHRHRALKTKAGEVDALKAKVAELEPKAAKVPELEQSIAALKAGSPDPAKFVPIDQVKTLQTEVAALKNGRQEREVDELVTAALTERQAPSRHGEVGARARQEGHRGAQGLPRQRRADRRARRHADRGRKPRASTTGKDAIAIAKAAGSSWTRRRRRAGRFLGEAVARVSAAA
jgi:phage I-like protein